jgi:hypothetical protein
MLVLRGAVRSVDVPIRRIRTSDRGHPPERTRRRQRRARRQAASSLRQRRAARSTSRAAWRAGFARLGASTADLLPGTTICAAARPHDLLHSIGGVLTLLPLLLLIDAPVDPPPSGWLTDSDAAAAHAASELRLAGPGPGDCAAGATAGGGDDGPHDAFARLAVAQRVEAAALNELCCVLRGDVDPGARLRDALAMLKVRHVGAGAEMRAPLAAPAKECCVLRAAMQDRTCFHERRRRDP